MGVRVRVSVAMRVELRVVVGMVRVRGGMMQVEMLT